MTLGSRRRAAAATASRRRDDFDFDYDAGSRIADEPHMTLGCSSIQVHTPQSPKTKKNPLVIPPNILPPLVRLP